ncbi:UNVERIFIED_CONTAM: hypothetical protein FKN15_033802 [Acipenser sinensis]
MCCECGTPIAPNPANMCVACLRTHVDITEGIPKQVSVHFCKQCERYLQPPATWMQCALESRELLTLCLKKLKASMTKVMNGAILQQVFVVEFVIQSQMCDDCHRIEAKDFWKAVVQVRQKGAEYFRKALYLEQMILKHKLHQNTLRIKETHDGIDFYYALKQHGQKMMDFLQCTVPCRSKTSQRLISHDIHTSTFNYKSTFSVEIVPICKAFAEVDGNTYWRSPFHSLCSPRQLEEFIVMDIETVRDHKQGAGAGMRSNKHILADVWVQKTSEMNTSQQYHCHTHLGHLLNHGDLVLGFDLANSNVNDEFVNKMNPHHIPDVVLIKKRFDRSRRQRRRNWRLKEMEREREGMDTDDERQYQDFLEDLEEDEALRKNINIFRDASKIPVESDTDDDGAPRVSLVEMLEDLNISEDATGGEGADMITTA